jgi:hypothetical protein
MIPGYRQDLAIGAEGQLVDGGTAAWQKGNECKKVLIPQ